MKDLFRAPAADSSVPDDAVYKEVVVVGNGPSGLALSYLLSGRCPYYNGQPHPDEMLTARLAACPSGQSLLKQDLQFLSQGLEGRSSNPVSVLVDCLTHPGADLGADSPPLLQWRACRTHATDHIVLGKGPPGGTWQTMDGNVLTISLSSWMELPGLQYRVWESRHGGPCGSLRRVPASDVAAYYRDYVRTMRLTRYLRSGVCVTSVRPIAQAGEACERVRWVVEGYELATAAKFTYTCRHVVLASGASDRPNSLGVPGEKAHPSWVYHDLAAFETALTQLANDNPGVNNGSRTVDPVCVVGAGLSAADAILSARFHSLPITHIFRQCRITPERSLPESMYPEYHKVHEMMRARGKGYPDYSAFPGHRVESLAAAPDRKVASVSPGGLQLVHPVSLVAVLIGSRPDLSYLAPHFHDGQALAVDPSKPLESRGNPLSVDPWTHRVVRAPAGLYAVGPLAGDNFVRFLLGGAVAAVSDMHRLT